MASNLAYTVFCSGLVGNVVAHDVVSYDSAERCVVKDGVNVGFGLWLVTVRARYAEAGGSGRADGGLSLIHI